MNRRKLGVFLKSGTGFIDFINQLDKCIYSSYKRSQQQRKYAYFSPIDFRRINSVFMRDYEARKFAPIFRLLILGVYMQCSCGITRMRLKKIVFLKIEGEGRGRE